MKKLSEFERIALVLNSRLGVTPLLYGSLGLSLRLNRDLKPEDIDSSCLNIGSTRDGAGCAPPWSP